MACNGGGARGCNATALAASPTATALRDAQPLLNLFAKAACSSTEADEGHGKTNEPHMYRLDIFDICKILSFESNRNKLFGPVGVGTN